MKLKKPGRDSCQGGGVDCQMDLNAWFFQKHLDQRHALKAFRATVGDEEGHSYSLHYYVILVMRRKFHTLA